MRAPCVLRAGACNGVAKRRPAGPVAERLVSQPSSGKVMGLNIATAKFSINCEKIKRADGGYQGFGLSFAGRFGAKLASRPDVLVVRYFFFLRFRPKNKIPLALLPLPFQCYRASF